MIQDEKRNSPTSSGFLDFHENNKGDKIVGGLINMVLIIILLATSASTIVMDWIDDRKPYVYNY